MQALVEVGDAGIADRGQDAAEVGVAREERGLHQRRVRDRVGHAAALGLVAAAFDAHGDELGRAFAVAHDRLRQLRAPRRPPHRAARGPRRCRATSIARVAGALRGDQHERIVGRRVAVDRDAVERLRRRLRAPGAAAAPARSPRRWRRSRASSPCWAGSCRRPWLMPVTVTVRPPICTLARRRLGQRVGGHDRLRPHRAQCVGRERRPARPAGRPRCARSAASP